MYGTYYKKQNKKSKSRGQLFSSIIPLILILVIGSAIGSIVINNFNKEDIKDNENINNKVEGIYQNDTTNNITNNENTNVINEESNSEEEKNSNESNNKQVKFDSSVAFIGDSRTQGLIMYNGLKEVQDYSYIGLMVDTAITKKFVQTNNGEKITLLEDMKDKNIKSVYIMLGVNELGWSYPEVFKAKYKELINKIRKIKPDCKIYVQSIIPMTKSKSTSDNIFNNENVEKFNKLIQEVAKEEKVIYLDVKSALIDSEGYLPEEASTDGIHLDIDYCEKWLNYLKNNS